MSRKPYHLSLFGCDDHTHIDVDLTDREVDFLNDLADKFDEASEYGCMPTMGVYAGYRETDE